MGLAGDGDNEYDERDEKVVPEVSVAIGGDSGGAGVNESFLRLMMFRVLALSFNSLMACIASIVFLVFSSTRSDVLLVSRRSLIVLVYVARQMILID